MNLFFVLVEYFYEFICEYLQIAALENKLEVLKHDKHEMFSQLKKILHEDDTRRRAREQR